MRSASFDATSRHAASYPPTLHFSLLALPSPCPNNAPPSFPPTVRSLSLRPTPHHRPLFRPLGCQIAPCALRSPLLCCPVSTSREGPSLSGAPHASPHPQRGHPRPPSLPSGLWPTNVACGCRTQLPVLIWPVVSPHRRPCPQISQKPFRCHCAESQAARTLAERVPTRAAPLSTLDEA